MKRLAPSRPWPLGTMSPEGDNEGDSETKAVPDLTGMEITEATDELRSHGFDKYKPVGKDDPDTTVTYYYRGDAYVC